ncbi:SAM-dependent methyltransferase [Kineosporia sp. NBRC 101731]|uniref:SAM-dependent methyltransferase n=1 Tax=Kineosporia sp. NBRC 101731 TaxID=3032199 RepID=UPI0024A2AAA5|nr:SAM-dependent methyltransferase [Kineosporia sp. NBRC 101731]GLY30754.1 hypothetical protein Kisp02_41190 [Kineosporia sp. NBRC 101731]
MQHNGEIEVAWDMSVPDADIYLVGYGNRLPNDFTLEMLAILKNCTRVFGVPPLRAPGFGIPEMENLMVHYGPDKKRRITYSEWLDRILDAAQADAPVAFATYGSAMVGTWVAHRILEEAPRRGLKVHVSNAVSFLDGMFADLNLEPFYGFSMWEATSFVTLGITPDTRAHLVLPQAPMFQVHEGLDPQTHTLRHSTTVTELRDHLLKFYPPGHEVTYIQAASGTGTHNDEPVIERMRLAELDHGGRSQGATLLVPGLSRPRALDFESATAVPEQAAG